MTKTKQKKKVIPKVPLIGANFNMKSVKKLKSEPTLLTLIRTRSKGKKKK